MLILMRGYQQEVIIRAPNGDVIRVVVLDGRTRLGFDTPRSYAIDRAEIDELKQAERA